MLIEFTVSNFRSIHQPITLSLEATNQEENPQNIFNAGDYRLLRSAAIYGANASGKSNVIRALGFMRNFVRKSFTKLEPGEETNVERFVLHTDARQQPASFQLIFLLDGIRYRYGFELDEKRVHSEWLYRTVQRETRLFVREGQEFDINTSLKKEAAGIQEKTRENALFLSTLAQFNGVLSKSIVEWFRKDLGGISGLNDKEYAGYTVGRIEENELFRQRVRNLLQMADVGIQDLEVRKLPLNIADVPDEVRDFIKSIAEKRGESSDEITLNEVKTLHPIYSDDGKQVEQARLDMDDDESEGTQKFFHMLGPIFDTLENGKVLIVDELDARLHPHLTRELVRLFNDPATNPNNAQLIFATHDAGLLGECLLRRDQVWFTEKNRLGATELYSLADFKERAEAAFDTRYLKGRYGGIPFVSGLHSYVEQQFKEQHNGA